MRTENYTCDRCGVTGDGRPAMTITFYYDDPHTQGRRADERDLCHECVAAALTWIEKGT